MLIQRTGADAIRKALAAFSLAGFILIGVGCNAPKYADSQGHVNQALRDNFLENVQASQDRATGVMTLTGSVAGQGEKKEARQIVRTAAPMYKIANKILVVSPAANKSGLGNPTSRYGR